MTLIKVRRPVNHAYHNWIDDVLRDLAPSSEKASTDYVRPLANITETQQAYKLELLAPGRIKEDFTINIDKNLLTVSYEKNDQKNEPQKDQEVKFIKKEFALQPFKRSFTLDDTIDSDNIHVKYENGVLVFNLPKKAPAPNKTITVE